MKEYLIVFLVGIAVCTGEGGKEDNENDLDPICDGEVTIDCVKQYFNKNGDCSVVDDADDTVTVDENLPIYLPFINLTVVTVKTVLSQLNGKIKTFAKDPRNGNLVLSVDFSDEGIYCSAPNTYFAVNNARGEPTVIREYVNATYPVQLTMIIPASEGLTPYTLRQSIYSAYFPHADASIYIGPKFTENPDFEDSFNGLLADKTTALKEIFNTKASYIFLAYIQSQICDFQQKKVIQNYDMTVIESVYDEDKDDEPQVKRPCEDSSNMMNCVQEYFKEHSSCSAVTDSNDEPVQRRVYTDETPFINSTFICFDAYITNLDGNIQDFYINEKTENLVLTVQFDSIRLSSEKCYLFINKNGDVPKIVLGPSDLLFPITINVVVPIGDGLSKESLTKSFITTVFNENLTSQQQGHPNTDKDPLFQKVNEEISKHPKIVGEELALTETPYFITAFLQTKLCDFGLPLTWYLDDSKIN